MSDPAVPQLSPAGERLLAATRIVLEHPFFPENVGATARAMRNCGLKRLFLIDGIDPEHPNARKMAVRSEALLDQAVRTTSLDDAISGASLVIGTTRMPYPGMRLLTPREAMPLMLDHAANGEIAWVFGNEKNGLSRDSLMRCHQVVRIPCVDPGASLNLSQAVMVIAYEVMTTALAVDALPVTRPMTGDRELAMLAENLDEALTRAGFFKPHQRPRREAILRRVLSRVALDADEAAVLHGVAHKLSWLADQDDSPQA